MLRQSIFYILILLVVGSCSKENNTPSEETEWIRPKATQFITTYHYNGEPDTISIAYNTDGQISERHFYGQISYYEYEDGLLAKEVNFYNTEPDTSHYERIYEYDDEQRMSKITYFARAGTSELTAINEYEFDYRSNGKVKVTNRGIRYGYTNISEYFFDGDNIEKVKSFSEDGDLSTEVFYTYTDIIKPESFSGYWIDNGLSSKHLPASVKIIDHTGLLDLACAFELNFTYDVDKQNRAVQADNGCYSVEFVY